MNISSHFHILEILQTGRCVENSTSLNDLFLKHNNLLNILCIKSFYNLDLSNLDPIHIKQLLPVFILEVQILLCYFTNLCCNKILLSKIRVNQFSCHCQKAKRVLFLLNTVYFNYYKKELM